MRNASGSVGASGLQPAGGWSIWLPPDGIVAVHSSQPMKHPSENHRQAPPAHGPMLMCDGGRWAHFPCTGLPIERFAGSTRPKLLRGGGYVSDPWPRAAPTMAAASAAARIGSRRSRSLPDNALLYKGGPLNTWRLSSPWATGAVNG